MNITMTPSDWLELTAHFASLSLLGVGGAITTTPELQRFLVLQQQWLSPQQFGSSIALAQAAPGPNILFIALMGWNVGLNAGGGLAAGSAAWPLGFLGVLVTMTAILLPSSVLTYTATRWAYHNRQRRSVRAFKQGMAPIVIALLVATGWLLSASNPNPAHDWRLWVLTALCALLVWKTRLHLLWMLATGAVLGALGWV